ncbi:putative secreted protein [Pedobacter sp. BAL39]|uniref:calcineurin-like phosphoesterase C-terminal domain-containing protein n=1 Tax=Pedobacter sp. BAL39 TaxID=391596 RepID=UPI000155A06A|nr:calcineurin-like phosphoesterase family protein [Pedobacter sp. BAL39]EDM35557.1 putative secreted protein [Pedobacter sp. BAL39]
MKTKHILLFFATILINVSSGFLPAVKAQSATGVPSATGFVYIDKNGNGKKDKNETGVANVAVSNGTAVVKTDKKGRYELPVGNDNIIFVIKPSGFGVPVNESMLPQYYYIHKPNGSPASMKYPGVAPTGPLPKEINFPLIPQKESTKFRALVFGDPQVYSQQDLDWFKKGILEEVKGIKGVTFGLSLGDLVGDNLHLFNDYKKEMATLGIPWYNMVGNHDLNFDTGVDSLSDESYEAQFGPANYSFEYGNTHFLILDDILAPDPRKNSGYWGGLRPDQLEFAKNDLANTDTSKLVVIAFHIPMKDYGNRAFRAADRVELFKHLKNHRHVVMFSGHTHLQQQLFYTKEEGWLHEGSLHEYNAGTTSGDWYSGELDKNNVPYATMRDGTEKGYAFLNLDGNTYTIDYKVAGKDPGYQMNIFAPKVIGHRKDTHVDFYANFFMGHEKNKVEFRIGNGDWKKMKWEDRIDPAYYERFERWDLTDTLMAGRRPSDAEESSHLWKGSISTELPVGKHTLQVRATDLFGSVFESSFSFEVKEPKPLPKVK